MASQITTQGSDGDKAIEMINSHFARQFSIGSQWQKIRVGIRLSCNNSPGATLTGNPELFVGLSHGTSSVFGDAQVSHSVGLISSGSWTWTSAQDGYFGTVTFRGCVKTGSSMTYFGSADNCNCINASGSGRSMFFVDLERNPTNTYLSCSSFNRSNTTINDINQTEFFFYLEQDVPSEGFHSYNSNFAFLPIDENTNGGLDSICVSWDRTVPRIVINDIAIYKFY